ncbi:hypothetical protein HPG69_011904, partial [Diceros bicornis minor]
AVSWAQGHPSHLDTPPNIYEGGLGAQQQQCPSAQGSKPKNFRLRHLRGLALYLPGHMQLASQCESHWLGRLMAGGCLPQPEGMQQTLGPGNSHCSALLEAQLSRDSLGNTGEHLSSFQFQHGPSQGCILPAWSPQSLGAQAQEVLGDLRGVYMPLVQENPLWGSGEAIGI